jgi:uncharacterized protein involved in outer membrane biogenesis
LRYKKSILLSSFCGDIMTDTTHKPKKSFRLFAILGGVFLALLVGLALIIPSLLDQSQYKDLIITKVKEASGYTISWDGDIHLSALPTPRAGFTNLSIKNGEDALLAVQDASVVLQLAPLLAKQIEISAVKLDGANITLKINKEGQGNWISQTLAQQKNTEAKTAGTPETSSPAAPPLKIGRIEFKNSKFSLQNDQTQTTQKIENINSTLKLESLKGAFDLDGSFEFNKQPIDVSAKIGEWVEGQPIALKAQAQLPNLKTSLDFDGSLAVAEKPLVVGNLTFETKDSEDALKALSGKETKLPEGLGGALNFSGKIQYQEPAVALTDMNVSLGRLKYEGRVDILGLTKGSVPSIKLDIASTANKDRSSALLGLLTSLKVKGQTSSRDGNIVFDDFALQFEGQNVLLNGSVTPAADEKSKPVLNLKVSSSRLNLDDLQKDFSDQTGSAAKATAEKNATTSVQGFSLPFAGRLEASVSELIVKGASYQNLSLDIEPQGQGLTIHDFSVTAPSATSLNVSGSIADSQNLSGLNLKVSGKTEDLEQLARNFSLTLPEMPRKIGSASLQSSIKGSLQNLNFDGTVNALQFAVTGQGQVLNPLSSPKIDALNFRVRHPSFVEAVRLFQKDFQAPQSFQGALNLSGSVALADKSYKLSQLDGSIGSTNLSGDLSLDMAGKPSLSGSLSLGALKFESSAPNQSKASSGAASSKSAETRWSREALPTSWLNVANADLSIRAQSITQGLWNLSNPTLSFKLQDGTLTIRDLTAGLLEGETRMSGVVSANQAAGSPLDFSWTMTVKNVNAQKLHSALVNSQENLLAGKIDTFDLSIKSSGVSMAALVQSLAGQGNLQGRNITINGIDANALAQTAVGSFKPLDRGASLLSAFQSGKTQFDRLSAPFSISSGIVNFSQILLDGPQSQIQSSGTINLPRWTIDLNNKMTIKNTDIPEFEFKISGPLDSPLRTGGSILENYLQKKVQAKAEKFIGDQLKERLGITLPGQETEPSAQPVQESPTAPDQTQEAPAPTETPKTPQDALKNIISDPNNIKPDDAAKALEGLFR